MRVGEIMQADAPCVDVDDTVVTVAREMQEHRLDQLPVCRDGSFVAMISQTDIVNLCVAAGLDPRTTRVEDFVHPDPAAVQVHAPAEEALLQVLHTGRRSLAVLDDDKLVGVLTQADLVDALPDETVSGIIAVVAGD